MRLRAALACSLLLPLACNPGPGDTTSGTSTGAPASTTTDTSGGTSGTSTPTTSGTTTGTTAASTTGATSGTTTGTTAASTTGATSGGDGPLCEDIIGSRDCAALVYVSGELTLETCMKCQGMPCGRAPECQEFPCIDQAQVLQGCCVDADCAGIAKYCGTFTATNNVCVDNDDL